MFPNSMTHIKMPFTISNKLTCNPHHFTINIYYRLDGQKVDKILASQNITCIWSTLQIENLQSFRNHAKLQNFEFSWDFRRAQELSKQISKSNVSPTAHRLKNIFHQKLHFSISELKRNTKKNQNIFSFFKIFYLTLIEMHCVCVAVTVTGYRGIQLLPAALLSMILVAGNLCILFHSDSPASPIFYW